MRTCVVELVEDPGLEAAHRQQHLGEHVERRHRHLDLLDPPLEDGPRHHRGVEEVAAVHRVDHPAAGLAHPVAGAADPLDRRGERTRRLEQQHLVELADVDAQLERVGGDDRLELAFLEPLLDHRAHLARERAVVRVGEVFALALVDQPGGPLGGAPAVGEDQGRAVAADHPADVAGRAGPTSPRRRIPRPARRGSAPEGRRPCWRSRRSARPAAANRRLRRRGIRGGSRRPARPPAPSARRWRRARSAAPRRPAGSAARRR